MWLQMRYNVGSSAGVKANEHTRHFDTTSTMFSQTFSILYHYEPPDLNEYCLVYSSNILKV